MTPDMEDGVEFRDAESTMKSFMPVGPGTGVGLLSSESVLPMVASTMTMMIATRTRAPMTPKRTNFLFFFCPSLGDRSSGSFSSGSCS